MHSSRMRTDWHINCIPVVAVVCVGGRVCGCMFRGGGGDWMPDQRCLWMPGQGRVDACKRIVKDSV